ncbi:MAG: cell division ATP-binding protein FtsE [Bdellovibrionia bacterium]
MITLSGVSKVYEGNSKVLDQVHLSLNSGEFLYVVGGSGAGKSSLLRILATQEMPTSGSVSLFGYDLKNSKPPALQNLRRSLGYVPQNAQLIGDLTVYENITLSLSLAGKKLTQSAQVRVIELLEKVGLRKKKDHLACTLSGGEAQRVAVVRALIRSPQLIIADEPTGGQDRDFKWTLMDLFLKANVAGATVVLATHDREVVRRLRKKYAVLRGGRVEVEELSCTY